MRNLLKGKNALWLSLAAASMFIQAGCGGGGGSAPVIYYPYETVYGDACLTFEATPGCTFNRDGSRITVSQDPDYNYWGGGSDDMWYVTFNGSGTGYVYNEYGSLVDVADISEFAGWVGGNYIGVGTTGLFWENVNYGTYWLGKNGVLYNANTYDSNFGKAINSKDSEDPSDSNFAALSSEANKALVKKGAEKLIREYGLNQDKAQAVASALNSWAVASADRGFTTPKDMDKTFNAVFGFDFNSALAAVKDLQSNKQDGMRDLTNRSAQQLGLSPQQAKRFMKGMYKNALASWGYDENSFDWEM